MADYYLGFDITGENASYFGVPDNAALAFGAGDFSIAFWMNIISYGTETYDSVIMDKTDPIDGYGFYFLIDDAGEVFFYLKVDGAEQYVSFGIIPTGTFYHFAITADRDGNFVSYLNGSVVNTDACTIADDITNAEELKVGYPTNDGAFVRFSGYLDDLRFHKSILTQSNILAIYNGGNGKKYTGAAGEGGAASAAWNFDEGTGLTVTDEVDDIVGSTTSGLAFTWHIGGSPLFESSYARNLIVYLPNHRYSEDDPVFVSWLNRYLYIIEPDTDSFKLADSGGNYVQYTEEVKTGYVREYDDTTGATTIDGLEHLEGLTVVVTNNGFTLGSYVVTNGSITLNKDVYNYKVGLQYAMKIRTMRLDVPQVETVQTKIKRINETSIRYLKSGGGEAGQEIDGTEYLTGLSAVFSDKSKDKSILTSGGFSEDSYTIIRSLSANPFTALAAVISFSVDEK